MSLVIATPPLRIGVWFDVAHISYGGPALVLVGTILGFLQDATATQRDVVILLNAVGDVNWSIGRAEDPDSARAKIPRAWYGPTCFTHADADVRDLSASAVWNDCGRVLFPSAWFRDYVCCGLPYGDAARAGARQQTVWSAGVDVDFFSPAGAEKTQDYFIYFKSQKYDDLCALQKYLFNNYFKIRGSVLVYYHYDPEMLRAAARASKFCIMLDATETQGLAALEILACDCPMFVLDATKYVGPTFTLEGATSVTCWDACCGLKSHMTRLATDFPLFMDSLATYAPRRWVVENHSYAAAAHRLREIISD
jgi:hypothetical protein